MLEGRIIVGSADNADKKATLHVKKTQHALERTKGLLGLPALSDEQGLWIIPCNSIHTFGMQYPLDIIYLDRNGRIKKIVENIKPRRMSFSLFAKSVLELKTGTVKRLKITMGHTLQWIPNA